MKHKTLEQVKNEVARTYGYDNWQHFLVMPENTSLDEIPSWEEMHDAVSEAYADQFKLKRDNAWYPEKCPITGLPFFSWIETPDGDYVPTYGGPFDSYTIPEFDGEDGYFTRERYDHDNGWWVDGGETCGTPLDIWSEWILAEQKLDNDGE